MPPATPPVVAPAVTPSEALVDLTWPKSPVPDDVGKQHGDFGSSEALRLEPFDDAFSLALGGGDTEYGF